MIGKPDGKRAPEDPPNTPGEDLRRRAEEKAAAGEFPAMEALGPGEAERLLHELQVHKIELELQNEELRRAQEELEASRARYFDLYELAPAGYLTLDGKGIVRQANLRAASLLGMPRGDLVGKPLSAFLDPASTDAYYLHRKTLQESGRAEPIELLFRREREGAFWGRLETTLEDASERAVLVDVTARREAEEAVARQRDELEEAVREAVDDAEARRMSLERQKEILQNVVDNIPVMLTLYDVEGNMLLWNRETERATGWSQDEVPRMDVMQAVYPDPALRRSVWDFMTRAEPGLWRELPMTRRDGSVFPSSWTNVRLADGQLIGIGWDMTERKRLETELVQSQKMEAVGRLTGGVAHDFNNMLHAIAGFANRLQRSLDPDDPRRASVNSILLASGRASEVTSRLLAFGRKQVLEPRRIDANEAVRNAVTMLRPTLGEDVEIVFDPSQEPLPVFVDAVRLEQTLVNLGLNAREAMTAGGRLAFATAGAGSDEIPGGRAARIAVSDTGCGMTEDVKARAFEPFFTTGNRTERSGLGLSMAYGFLRQSGGDIRVESAPGEGTTFTLEIPLWEGTEEERGARPEAEEPPSVRGTVLLVEDEALVRDFTEAELKELGCDVIPARDAPEALRKLRKHAGTLDLLLTDVVLPGAGGRELASSVRAERPGVKVLYMSGRPGEEAVENAGEPVLSKPFDTEDLARALDDMLG